MQLCNGDAGLGSGCSCPGPVHIPAAADPGAPVEAPRHIPGRLLLSVLLGLVVRLDSFHMFMNNLSSLFMNGL